MNFFKCGSGGDENPEYFTFLIKKFVNRHLYKQSPFASNPLDTFCLSYTLSEIDCLGDYFDTCLLFLFDG